jgi:pimeloyl-ACP methyl ester carboxylesterase
MRTTLVSIPTATKPLDGAYYEPEGRKPAGAVLLFHGNTMNFYYGPPRFLPPALTELGLACLAFNRRGHDIMSTRDSRDAEGAAYQTAAEAIADNRTAGEWLGARGFAHPIVIGHSHGGMLAVRHAADHPQTPALVLLSAHRGGKGLVPGGSKAGLLAGDKFDEIVAQSKALVAAGKPNQLILMPGWWYVVTAAGFLDMLENLPDVIELAPKVKSPTLYVRGDQEPAGLYPAEEFKSRAGGECTIEIPANCNHFYVGREDAIAALVAKWLGKTLNLR